jgi:predicted dehydrogenase
VLQRLRTGVAGAGVFGSYHARKFAAAPNADLMAIYDTDEGRAKKLASETGATPFVDFDKFLLAVEAVTVAAPAPAHFDLARRALTAGRHVYVEKPIALNLTEADALIGLADEFGLILQVGHQERFVLDALGLPRIGRDPRRLEFTRCGPTSGRCEDVCVVFDLMVHDLDLCRLFDLGSPEKVSACGDTNETVASIFFSGGGHCTFVASRRREERIRNMTAEFDDGVVSIDFLARRIANSTTGSVKSTFDDEGTGALQDPLGCSVQAFIDSASGGAPPMIDGRAGRGALELALLIIAAREETKKLGAVVQRKIA